MTTFPRFYPIFDSADWLRRALPWGVRLVQVRIKDMPPPLLMGELALCQELCREHGATLVINDHWRAAIDLGCDFVHLGQEDLDRADVAAIRRAGMRLGVSTHDHDELDRALARGEVQFAVVIPQDFTRRVVRGENPTVLIEADAADQKGGA